MLPGLQVYWRPGNGEAFLDLVQKLTGMPLCNQASLDGKHTQLLTETESLHRESLHLLKLVLLKSCRRAADKRRLALAVAQMRTGAYEIPNQKPLGPCRRVTDGRRLGRAPMRHCWQTCRAYTEPQKILPKDNVF